MGLNDGGVVKGWAERRKGDGQCTISLAWNKESPRIRRIYI